MLLHICTSSPSSNLSRCLIFSLKSTDCFKSKIKHFLLTSEALCPSPFPQLLYAQVSSYKLRPILHHSELLRLLCEKDLLGSTLPSTCWRFLLSFLQLFWSISKVLSLFLILGLFNISISSLLHPDVLTFHLLPCLLLALFLFCSFLFSLLLKIISHPALPILPSLISSPVLSLLSSPRLLFVSAL